MIAFAALTMGLLGSCSKINERLDNLDKRIDGIKTSISDLGQIRSDISSLKQSASDHSVDIFNLEEADRALKDRILNLEEYVDLPEKLNGLRYDCFRPIRPKDL